MIILKIILLIFTLFPSHLLAESLGESPSAESNSMDNCFIPANGHTIKASWFIWEPYQFVKLKPELGEYSLSGMDIELLQNIANNVGVKINYERVELEEALQQLEAGNLDMINGMSYSISRAQYAYYSEPYRFDENSIFVLKKSDWTLNFQNINEFLAQVRLQNFRLGVNEGFIYADDQINDFIRDQTNHDIIFKYDSEKLAIEALLKEQIDGFIADRLSGATIILNKGAVDKIDEFPLGIKSPIHIMFSKKQIPLILVHNVNYAIKKFINSPEYKQITKAYLYPVLMIYTCHSKWFYFIGIIGAIAFAISGLAIGSKENLTFFSTLLLAIIPSVAGSIMRDVVVTSHNVRIVLTPHYMYYTLVIVLVGFAAIRLLHYYNTASQEDYVLQKFWDNVIVIGDALGQASFITIGVTIVIMNKIEPIELWGPFFAFFTAHSGILIREIIYKNNINMLSEINAEITIFWSLIFSVFLSINSSAPDSEKIKALVIIVTCGAFATRLIVHYFKIPNIRFRKV